jgi:6-phosphogluconolactonase (cycloisomerase 2 family)
MSQFFYIGCYTEDTGGSGEGISVGTRDPHIGILDPIGTAAITPSPSFLAQHPRLPVLYAANELTEGVVSAWAVQPDGALRPLGTGLTGGADPCHLAVVDDHLVTANYSSGSVSVHRLDASGAIGERTDLVVHQAGRGPDHPRQEQAHAHMVAPIPAGGLHVVDLGADTIYAYTLDGGSGRLVPAGRTSTPPGAGPRHLARDAAGFVYVADELDATITVYKSDGVRLAEHDLALAGISGGYPSEIAVSSDGRFLYLASRGPDIIAVFQLPNGRPVLIGEVPTRGAWPRHFAMMDGYLYVANERSHTVVTFRIDPDTGLLRRSGPVWDVPSPTCVLPFRRS